MDGQPDRKFCFLPAVDAGGMKTVI